MAVLYISEYATMDLMAGIIAPEPALVEQTKAIGGSTAQSSAFGVTTRVVRIHTDAACHILFGANPTATTSSKRMAAGATEYFAVTPGHKVAVIASS